jgi:hypothetical protein
MTAAPARADSSCKDGDEKSGLLCYPVRKSGYHRVGRSSTATTTHVYIHDVTSADASAARFKAGEVQAHVASPGYAFGHAAAVPAAKTGTR